MEVTNQATSEKKTAMAELFQYCIGNGSITVEAVHLLMQECLEKDKQIAELTQTIANLTQRITNLENKVLKKAGRQKQLFMVNGQELTDEYLMQLINEGYYKNIGELEKDVGAHKKSATQPLQEGNAKSTV